MCDIFKDILHDVVTTDWPFTKLMTLQKDGIAGRVMAYYDESLHSSTRDQGWFELVYIDDRNERLVDKRLFGLADATEQQVAEELGYTLADKIHFFQTKEEVKSFFEGLILDTQDDPHAGYFQVLSNVAQAAHAAMEDAHVAVEKVAGGRLTTHSQEYANAIEKMERAYAAMHAMLTHVADVQFHE